MELLNESLASILNKYPQVETFLQNLGLPQIDSGSTLGSFLDTIKPDDYEDLGMDREILLNQLLALLEVQEKNDGPSVRSITIIGG